jgi:hypothetical protein
MMSPVRRALIVGLSLTIALGCASKDQTPRDSSDLVSQQGVQPTRASSPRAPVAARPTNDCEWIPVADVEAIVGKLAEPPRKGEGGCIYTLPIPQKVLDNRAKLDEVRAKIAKMPGADKSMSKAKRYDTYGFVLDVALRDEGATENVGKAVGRMFATTNENDSAASAIPKDSMRTTLGGWDAPGMPYGGRIGHIRVSITPIASDFDLPRDKLETLAVRVRDRIPDRPFPMVGNPPKDTHDPCALITRQEAEKILGALVVPPYRSADDGPFAYDGGPSCVYYTSGHHVLIVTPHWSDGKVAFGASRGIGSLVASVARDGEAQAADTLEGPWDQAATGPDGRLAFLKGERSLEVSYRASSTDKAGAVKLVRMAIPRLVASKE